MSGYADIRPGGLNQRELVNFLYMAVASLKLLCQTLDDDTGAGIGDDDYEALCYTAIIKTKIYDNQGNETGDNGAEEQIITPAGISAKALNEVLYQIVDAWETLCEKLDDEGGLTATDYEELCYHAIILGYGFEKGNSTTILGNDNTSGGFSSAGYYKFGPSGMPDDKHLIDFLYDYIDAFETLAEKLDATGAEVNTATYEADCFEAIFTMRVENSEGNILGNANTWLG